MAVDTTTVTLLRSVLESDSVRKLFTTIADSRIAEAEGLKKNNPVENFDSSLVALEQEDLIGVGKDRKKYYVTAKGLKVARDLQQLSIR